MNVKEILNSLPGEPATRFFLQHLKELITYLQLTPDDERLAIDYRAKHKGISVNINRRLTYGLYSTNGATLRFMLPTTIATSLQKKYGFHIDQPFLNSGPDASLLYIPYSHLAIVFDDNVKAEWLKACEQYLPKGTKSNYRKHHLPELFDLAMDETAVDRFFNQPPDTFLLVNITWNSNNWRGISEDKSAHKWVSKGNTPHESWNFDFSNPRNPTDAVYGFAQFTNSPKVTGRNNLLIFYSQNQIVGFYGRAQVLAKYINLSKKEAYNLIGDRSLSLVLENKIEQAKEKGFLEDLQRIGQVGFSYLHKRKTVLNILKQALKLNPDASVKLNALINWVNNGTKTTSPPTTKPTNIVMPPLNQILYGPPGTGKTYTTIEQAIRITNPAFEFVGKTRKQVKEEYERLQKRGQIEFVTFHQSMTYEDFIEGIKPESPKPGDTYLKYEIKPGIFKRLVAKALFQPSPESSRFSISEEEFIKATFYKISLGNTANPDDDQIFQYCMENKCIALGWGGAIDFTGKSEEEIQKMVPDQIEKFAAQEVNMFIHYLKQGDYVVVSFGNLSFRAIGIVTGDYEYRKVDGLGVNQFRKVRWLLKNQNIPVEELYYKQFQQQTLYKLNRGEIKKEFFVKGDAGHTQPASAKENYVLIIDEINRGNISQIFGELITLIEDDKRKGREEELEVTLPYSGDRFCVPDNLYIIGTMNTADRSVEALDTALRRRFSFVEMQANAEHNDLSTAVTIAGSVYNFQEVLATLNMRLEKLIGRDHQIGHSYFLSKNGWTWENYRAAFTNKIIPLLQEYFYGDYAKMCLVVGKGFVDLEVGSPKADDDKFFAAADHEALDSLLEKPVWRLKTIETAQAFADALNLLLNK